MFDIDDVPDSVVARRFNLYCLDRAMRRTQRLIKEAPSEELRLKWSVRLARQQSQFDAIDKKINAEIDKVFASM